MSPRLRKPDYTKAPREHTWVRKETVKKTKDAFFSKNDESQPDIPVNERLAKKLTATQSQ